MVRCGSNNAYKKEMCSNDIKLHAQTNITILDSIVSIVYIYIHICVCVCVEEGGSSIRSFNELENPRFDYE